MLLKDVLIENEPTDIMWRIVVPESELLGILGGYAYWDGKELHSADGDTYSVEEEITGFLRTPKTLIYWTNIE